MGERGRRLLLLSTFFLTICGLMLVVTNGFVTTALGFRVSARSPGPAFIAAAASLLAWLVAARRARAVHHDLTTLECWMSDRVRVIGAVVAAAAAGLAIGFNSFSAAGSDASGYLSQSVMLLEGRLIRTEALAPLATWEGGPATLAPLGWVATPSGDQVPTYAVGLPLLMAPLHALGGADAASLLVPASLALAVIAVGALAGRIAGAWAASIAAVWFATSPVALIESMQIMSDVPATAAWMSCWWLVFCGRHSSAGLVAALAVLIRPNLAPLAVLPAAFLFVRGESQAFRPGSYRGFAFALPVALAGLVVGSLQWLWFGSPLRSGYGSASEIYSLSNLAPNAALYTAWLVEAHGPWLLIAPAALMLPRLELRSRLELRWMLFFAAAVVAAYLVYAQFEVWTYLRFLLPALAVAMIAVAVVLTARLSRLPVTLRVPLLAAVLLAVISSNVAAAKRLDVFRFADRHVRARVVGERLAEELPRNAVLVSGEQSGAMRYYTGRSILRWDAMIDPAMHEALERLSRHGYQVWVVLDDWEEEVFRRRFPALAAAALDQEPMVESAAGVGIRTRAWRVRSFSARSSNRE
jgi:hypothetical protein